MTTTDAISTKPLATAIGVPAGRCHALRQTYASLFASAARNATL